jgi:hypothetical protein
MKILKTANYIKKMAQFDGTYEHYEDDGHEDARNFAEDYDNNYWDEDIEVDDEEDIYEQVLDLIDTFNHKGFEALKLVERGNGRFALFIADNIKGENQRFLASGVIGEIRDEIYKMIEQKNNDRYPTDTPMGMEDDNPIEEDYGF